MYEFSIKNGDPYPLGSTIKEGGVNFSIFVPEATTVSLLLFKSIEDSDPYKITLDPTKNASYYYWHVFVENIGTGQLYGYIIDVRSISPSKRFLFDPSKVLLDPYGKSIVGTHDRMVDATYGKSNLKTCLKSAVIADDFDWQGVEKPHIPLERSIVYEMHLAGFTKHESANLADNLKGTFSGLIEKIPYLKSLGITAVELMPIFSFDELDAPKDKTNYWGYSPIGFFSPHQYYSSSEDPQSIVNECKTMVRELHRAGIEVILDVVYNHTAEANRQGPTYSFRGISNSSYYILDYQGNYKDYSGCGNTFNTNHSVVRRLIYDSVIYWTEQMQIDGFRFDLASVMSRDEEGHPMRNPPVLWALESNPRLANTKLIAEPWDAAGLYQVSNFTGNRWAIWNGQYRDDVRKFIKGDKNIVSDFASCFLGSKDVFASRSDAFHPSRSINFISCHDGFTLNDLVSYEQKHNEDNGEYNRDGSNDNFSWNCGVEGYTEDPTIEEIRKKQIKNFLIVLFLSQGTPMLSMGDEVRRTLNGNNNSYCQDTASFWFDWSLLEQHQEIFTFTQKVIEFSKRFPMFNYKQYIVNHPTAEEPYIIWHGNKPNRPDWSSVSRSIACELVDPRYNDRCYIAFNAHWDDLHFELPDASRWTFVFNTVLTQQEESLAQARTIVVAARSIVVLQPSKNI